MLVARDGARCWIGHEMRDRRELIVDHWDGNNANNHPSNLHLLCKAMNSCKNPRGPSPKNQLLSSARASRVTSDGTVLPYMVKIQSAEFLKNTEAEPTFRHWLFYNIVRCVTIEVNEVVACGAELARCSPDTIKKYLTKVVCTFGLYQYDTTTSSGKTLIRLKPQYESFRRTIEKREILEMQTRNWKGDRIRKLKRDVEAKEDNKVNGPV